MIAAVLFQQRGGLTDIPQHPHTAPAALVRCWNGKLGLFLLHHKLCEMCTSPKQGPMCIHLPPDCLSVDVIIVS